jgi:hypothetical protein
MAQKEEGEVDNSWDWMIYSCLSNTEYQESKLSNQLGGQSINEKNKLRFSEIFVISMRILT